MEHTSCHSTVPWHPLIGHPSRPFVHFKTITEEECVPQILVLTMPKVIIVDVVCVVVVVVVVCVLVAVVVVVIFGKQMDGTT